MTKSQIAQRSLWLRLKDEAFISSGPTWHATRFSPSQKRPASFSPRRRSLQPRRRQLCAAQSAASVRDATMRRRHHALAASAHGTRAPLRAKTKTPTASARRTRVLLRPMACAATFGPRRPHRTRPAPTASPNTQLRPAYEGHDSAASRKARMHACGWRPLREGHTLPLRFFTPPPTARPVGHTK